LLPGRVLPALTNLDGLHGLDRKGSTRDASIEPKLFGGVRAEPWGAAKGAHFDNPAERVLILLGLLDLGHHLGIGVGIDAADLTIAEDVEIFGGQCRVGRGCDRAHAYDMTMDANPDRVEQVFAHRSDSHSRRRLAGRCTLEHVTDIGELVLHDTREVGMPRARHNDGACAARRNFGELLFRHSPGALGSTPVSVITVLDDQADWTTDRAAVSHPAKDRGLICFDRLAGRTSIAGLATSQIALQSVTVDVDARGQAAEDRDDAGTMRLARGDEGERHLFQQGIAAGGLWFRLRSCVHP
jgi:hypothetical protein